MRRGRRRRNNRCRQQPDAASWRRGAGTPPRSRCAPAAPMPWRGPAHERAPLAGSAAAGRHQHLVVRIARGRSRAAMGRAGHLPERGAASGRVRHRRSLAGRRPAPPPVPSIARSRLQATGPGPGPPATEPPAPACRATAHAGQQQRPQRCGFPQVGRSRPKHPPDALGVVGFAVQPDLCESPRAQTVTTSACTLTPCVVLLLCDAVQTGPPAARWRPTDRRACRLCKADRASAVTGPTSFPNLLLWFGARPTTWASRG